MSYYDELNQKFKKESVHAFNARNAPIPKIPRYIYPEYSVECHIDGTNRWVVYSNHPLPDNTADKLRKEYFDRNPVFAVLKPSTKTKKGGKV